MKRNKTPPPHTTKKSINAVSGSPISVTKITHVKQALYFEWDKYLATSVLSRHLPDYPAGGSPSRPWRCFCFRFLLKQTSLSSLCSGLDTLWLLLRKGSKFWWMGSSWPLRGEGGDEFTLSCPGADCSDMRVAATKRAHSNAFCHRARMIFLSVTGGFHTFTHNCL